MFKLPALTFPLRLELLLFTFDVSVDLLLRVQVVQTLQDLLQHGGDLRLVEGPRPQLQTDAARVNKDQRLEGRGLKHASPSQQTKRRIVQPLTKSSAEPPPRYSMMIHSLLPWKGSQVENRCRCGPDGGGASLPSGRSRSTW